MTSRRRLLQMSDVYPELAARLPPGANEYYLYAAENKHEYFAVGSEGYFTRNGQRQRYGLWPQNVTMFEEDDPVGYAALDALWKRNASDIQAAFDACVPESDDRHTLVIIVSLVVLVCLLCVCTAMCYFCLAFRRERKGAVSVA